MTVTVLFDNGVNSLPATLQAEFVAAVNDAVATINTTLEDSADITINVGYGEVVAKPCHPA